MARSFRGEKKGGGTTARCCADAPSPRPPEYVVQISLSRGGPLVSRRRLRTCRSVRPRGGLRRSVQRDLCTAPSPSLPRRELCRPTPSLLGGSGQGFA